MRKRITSLLLTLVMLLSLVPAMGVTASAAEPEWTTVNSFEELQTAVKAKKEYIKLGQDIDTSSLTSGVGLTEKDLLYFGYQNFVLDLNGKTLNLYTKLELRYFIQVANGSLTIKDGSTAKTGAITGFFGSTTNTAACYFIWVREDSGLTLEGGTFSAQGKPYGTRVTAVQCGSGSVTIKDGVTISQPEFFDGGYAYDLDGNGYALSAVGKSKVIIEGGEFNGSVKLTGYQDTNGSVQINGGTFKKDVQVLYEAEENNSDPAVTVNGGTFEGNVYLEYWPWGTSLYMPYRLNGGTFKGTVNLNADGGVISTADNPTGNPSIALGLDKCFGYSAVVTPGDTFTGPNAYTVVLKRQSQVKVIKCRWMALLPTPSESSPTHGALPMSRWTAMRSTTPRTGMAHLSGRTTARRIPSSSSGKIWHRN